MVTPRRIVKLRLPGRKGGTQPSKEATVDTPPVEDRAAVPAAGSESAGQQAHGIGIENAPNVHIKQEPTSRTADILAIATTSTANPINEAGNISAMSDAELSANLDDCKSEEDRISKNESQGILKDFYTRESKLIRNKIKLLEEEQSIRQRRLSGALNAKKSLGLGKLSALARSDSQSTRSLCKKRKSGNSEISGKRPKITEKTRQFKDTVMNETFSLIKGEVSTVYDKDATKTLPQIGDAPAHLRDHLQAIRNAALQRPGVEKDLIDHDIRVFVGILIIFGPLLQSWVSPGDGPKTVADFKWLLVGMIQPLYHHQVPAIGVMVMIEKDLKAGLLFDHMGLGKSIEILGCIVMNPPVKRKGNRSKKGHTTTLIVVPKSALMQWEKEVQRHCQDLEVGLYDKEESEQDPEGTLSNDILLVTYDQLHAANRMASLKRKKKQNRNPRISLLFKSTFYRVCLDEAQRVKGRDTETFRLCCKLQATHRWCVSGTPTPNVIAEIYSYLKFIKHPHAEDFPTFRDQYLGGKDGELFPEGVENKYEKLDRLLAPIMIMRNPGQRLLGGALVELPETHFHAIRVPLSAEEDVIYKFVEDHIGAYINSRSGKAVKKKPSKPRKKPQNESSKASDDMSGGLDYIGLCEVTLRLRQLVASPLLLEKLVKGGIWTATQVREMRDEAHSRGCVKTPFIDQFESWISEPNIPQATSKKANRSQRKKAEIMRTCCPECSSDAQKEPHRSQCLCIWCKDCVDDRIDTCKRKGREILCPRCKRSIGILRPCELPGGFSPGPGNPNNERPRMRGEDFLKFAPKEDFESSLFRHLDANPEAEVPLSSKMRATLDQIQGHLATDPQNKIVLFSQFIDIQRLLGRVLQDHGIEYLYFMGEMDYDQREAAKEQFRTNPDIKVIIMSMQCGGEAINLTSANGAIVMDPWWNRSVEMQAICRVARIGQTKDVHAFRILAENTVDSRMYRMQQIKIEQVETALEKFQEDKSFGVRALRIVAGARFTRPGDEDDGALFKDQDEIEEDEEYFSAGECGPSDEGDDGSED